MKRTLLSAASVLFITLPLPAQDIPAAVQRGLAFLVSQQQGNGSWQDGSYSVAPTALAVVKLEEYAYELGYESPFDTNYIYYQNVENGLAFLFQNARTNGIQNQQAGNPDSDGDGIGVAFGSPTTYSLGTSMMAIAGSRTPNRVINVAGSPVNGQTYKQVLDDCVDFAAWGQNEGSGAWRYEPNSDTPDNSNTGWMTSGLAYAEAPFYEFECQIPAFVKSELSRWLSTIQGGSGASGYTSPGNWENQLKTGNLLFELAFVGDDLATSNRLQRALGWVEGNWNLQSNDLGWRPNYFQAMYTVMRGLTILGRDTVNVGGTPRDWYMDLATAIVNSQQGDGGWPADVYGGRIVATEWALLTLEAVAVPPDCNNNGIPDDEELENNDCNTNTIPDDCDIANGTSQDANTDGVPDECCAPPSFPVQPLSQTVCPGTDVSFTFNVTGNLPITTQWRKDGVNIGGQTGTSLVLPAVTAADAGEYTVFAENECGTNISATAILVVDSVPEITQDLQDIIACPGDTVAFTIGVEGTAPLNYQWQKNGGDLPGGSDGTLTINNVNSGDAADYNVIVTNHCGIAYSVTVTLTVLEDVAITQQPTNVRVCPGVPVSFDVVASGTQPITYQWYKDGVPIPGATSADFLIPSANPSDSGNYTVVVTNQCSTLTSRVAVLIVDTPPTITGGPNSLTVCPGDPANFGVTLQGTQPFGYQWYKDGVPIPGATGAAYQDPNAQAGDAGSYTVVVTNVCGSAQSGPASLTVLEDVVITQQPISLSACPGGSVTFEVVATGSPTIRYQWQKNLVSIPGATQRTYTINPVLPTSAGIYRVVVSNDCSTVFSNNAALILNSVVQITQHPVGGRYQLGQRVVLTCLATGTPPLRFQWRFNGTDIPGATTNTLILDPLRPQDVGVYTCVVSNVCGPVVSNPAVITTEDCSIAITQHPLSQILCAEDRLTLTAMAAGDPVPLIQWRKDGVSLPGSTGNTLMIASSVPADTGTYDVEVSNSCGALISDAASVVVWPRGTGDVNGDGVVDGLDVTALTHVLINDSTGPADLDFCGSDMNHDGIVTYADVPLFIDLLLGR